MTEATSEKHPGDLLLRRLRGGERLADGQASAAAHTATCARCRARLKDFDDEQQRFEQAISFDRFAAGVERAARSGSRARGARPAAGRRWGLPSLGLVAAAAALVLAIGVRDGQRGEGGLGAPRTSPGSNGLKGGGAGIVVRIGGAGGDATQRDAAGGRPEMLARGERIRIGYWPGEHRYLIAVSLDDQGRVTALYPESGRSLEVAGGGETRYLPDSVEFTGAGAERLVVVLSDQPLALDTVKRAAEDAYRKAGGDLIRLPALDVGQGGEQFARTFLKP
jgi:hypothetical protein